MRRHGFTLVELLAAIAVISVLMGLIIGAASMAFSKPAKAKTISLIQQMEIALQQYYEDRGFYPQSTKASELAWQVSGFKDTSGRTYLEGYDPDRFIDSWGNKFWYQCPGVMNEESFDLWSKGTDGAHGEKGVDDDADGSTDEDGRSQASPYRSDAQTPNADNSDDIANWKRNN